MVRLIRPAHHRVGGDRPTGTRIRERHADSPESLFPRQGIVLSPAIGLAALVSVKPRMVRGSQIGPVPPQSPRNDETTGDRVCLYCRDPLFSNEKPAAGPVPGKMVVIDKTYGPSSKLVGYSVCRQSCLARSRVSPGDDLFRPRNTFVAGFAREPPGSRV